MVKRILILFALSLCSWEIYAQDILSIHTKSGVVKSIPFAKSPELYFDKTDVIKVVTAGSIEEIPYAEINKITIISGKGDVNCDNFIDKNDVNAIVNHLLGYTPDNFNEGAADVNGDGNVNISDIVALINLISILQKD